MSSTPEITADEVKEILRLGWDDHMADFAGFSEGEMSLLLHWCGLADHDPFGYQEYAWTIRTPDRLRPDPSLHDPRPDPRTHPEYWTE